MQIFNQEIIHPSWNKCVKEALQLMDKQYLDELYQSSDWLPGAEKIFSAFSMPMNEVNYVLFGESPYPRKESANGFAFWDADVKALWSTTGLDKKVNRATSLRNIIKMLLVAENKLPANQTSQDNIAALDKNQFIKTNADLFNNFIQHGFLLLNATLVLGNESPQKDAKAWHPFTFHILNSLISQRPQVKFILLGNIAKQIEPLLEPHSVQKLCAEHPYNLSFIQNRDVIQFFQPFHLLLTSC
jgi:uracil-DNA glycosylase